jgi:excisionase family DNA binding protein
MEARSVEILLDRKETARRMSCTTRHLERLIAEGKGPPSIKVGRLRRWPESQFDKWIQTMIEAERASAE